MASEDVQTNLRLPADLKDRLHSSAAENNRSLSAEVSHRLMDSFESDTSREEMLRLSLRLERDLFAMELEASTSKMSLGIFASKVEDLLDLLLLEELSNVPEDLISELRENCRDAYKEAQDGYKNSQQQLEKMKSAAAKLGSMPQTK
ncbi:Arc family DNA-binding protein [Comamonas koreensis]|uniref:Arc family DNA-binding protein n=1 Tax=Comamonas koreensis TaxID=160825 RepID=A0AAW4XVE6_9BURK|nr:Arc family DNA-binding protein [Comamonas koreensis]MCD2164899.1 Arc family DNA-binding protein [Comamonas koreensis]